MTLETKAKVENIFLRFGNILKTIPKEELPTDPDNTMVLLQKHLDQEEIDFLDRVHDEFTQEERNYYVRLGFIVSGRYIIKDRQTPKGMTFDLFIVESV